MGKAGLTVGDEDEIPRIEWGDSNSELYGFVTNLGWLEFLRWDKTGFLSFFGVFHDVPPYKDFGKKGIIVIFHSLNGQNEMR